MRQMTISVPRGCADKVLAEAEACEASELGVLQGTRDDKPVDIVVTNVPNARIEGLMDALEPIGDLHVTFAPQGVFALRPPDDEAREQVVDIQPRSPVEIFLGGLQSVGSWKGFLGYAAAGGVVVWIGLFTEVMYLLTAAMLIAPFAGPAMNAALATARGDGKLFARSLGRYFAALAVTILVAFLLSVIFRQEIATSMMVNTSFRSSVSILLPLTAGAAGALNLAQSERSSLVSGAATGMLVAASLAPPAGLVGMGLAIGEWGIVYSSGWVLFLQIAGINLSGFIVFRLYGVNTKGARFSRGNAPVGQFIFAGTLVLAAGLLWLQFSNAPELLRSSLAQRISAETRDVVETFETVELIQANARFTRADVQGQNTVLITIYAQGDEEDAPRQALGSAVKRRIAAEYNVTPLVDVTILEP